MNDNKILPPNLQPGDRIILIDMPEDPDPILPGATGTVESCLQLMTGYWQVNVRWDNGRGLALSVPPDKYGKIKETF